MKITLIEATHAYTKVQRYDENSSRYLNMTLSMLIDQETHRDLLAWTPTIFLPLSI